VTRARPPVSVVVPFLGDDDAARRLLAAFGRLRIGPGDELIVADNTASGVASSALNGEVVLVAATREQSSYHARNEGARRAGRDWLLFLDADCIPEPDLVDAYFADPIPDACGAVAGAIVPSPHQTALAARYAQARNFLVIPREPGAIPTAPTGNLLVRRSAFERVGGFEEGIRSGGDVDFCRRLQAAGLTLELRPAAVVQHRHRERLSAYLRTVGRYAAGARWLEDRYPGIAPRWPLARELGRAARDAARLWAKGDEDEAAFRALDGLSLVAHNLGYRLSNQA
jgi:cellulose synthase/poly-beta-1,6-N-acetylglucosamine synthase-like glycosyltransferase